MTVRITLLLLTFHLAAMAQPANDDCNNAVDLGIAPYCESTLFTNAAATPSDIGSNNIPPCWDAGTVQRDVWFVFTASDTILDYSITITGESDAGGSNPLTNPQVAVYRGDCGFNDLFFFGCFKSPTTGATNLKFSLTGLTPGAQYWLRISDFPEASANNAGTFKLCIEQKSPLTNIIEGFSKECEGLLVDTGGPDENYGPDENFVFTICPEIPSQCIELIFSYFELDFGQDAITIYDGPNTSSTQIGLIMSTGVVGDLDSLWGGVCKRFVATSGCMTIEFHSGDINEYAGFLAEWKCSTQPCKTFNQPLIQSSFSETEVLQNLTSPQAIVTFDKIVCGDGASGLFFNGDQTDLGLNKGILLTTGSSFLAQGPNNSGSAGASPGTPGDADLDILSILGGANIESFDACILELDVYANTNEISFEYVFGSEEYPEYAGTQFNDIFAFLISGPGISGIPQIGNQDNMAILPDGSPVEINNVNYQQNWEYYRSNDNGVSLQYDGLTSDYLGKKKSLTARYSVEPCQTYHLKLAIADRGDSSFDSGVFISEIKGGAPAIAVDFKNGIDYLVEDCTTNPDEIIISLNSPLDVPLSYNMTIGGTATAGTDYTLNIPSVITFQPGETSYSFPIVPISDGLLEGDETITITLSNDFGCGNVIFAVLTIVIRDNLEITVNGGQDTVLYCPNTSVGLSAEGATSYFWEPVAIFNDPSSASTVATPTGSMWVEVTGQLGVCVAADSIFLQQVNPQIAIDNPSPVAICQGNPVLLSASNNLDGQGSISWMPTFGLNNPNGPTTLANPTFTVTYTVTANLTGCVVTDTITVNVTSFNFPNVIPDFTICQGNSIQLANDLFSFSTSYNWSPAVGLDDVTVSGPIATPDVTTTYKLIAESGGGTCMDSAEVTITVIPSALTINTTDTVYFCLGDTIPLSASFTPGGLITWLPSDSTKLIQTGQTAQVFGPTSFWAIAEMTTGPCVRRDSVFVRVDSLPDLAISKFVDRPFYCEGEIITFLSSSYLNTDYPDIEHLWVPNNGNFLTPDSNLNLVLVANESFTFTRQTKNNACVENQAITITVIPAGLELSPSTLNLCPGDTAQVFLLEDSIVNIQWTPSMGLSCTTCTDPIITASSTQVYQIMAEQQGCVKQGTLLVNVPVPGLNLIPILKACEGEVIELNPNADPATSYSWTSSDPNFGTSSEANPQVTALNDAIYYVTATIDGCTLTGEMQVVVIKQPTLTISASDTDICQGDVVTIVSAGLPAGGTYLWTLGGETSAEITVSPPVTTTYEVTYTTENQCFTVVSSISITVSVPGLNLLPIIKACEGDIIELNTNADPATSYFWTSSDPNFGTSSNANPQITALNDAIYYVTATLDGCAITGELQVLVIKQPTVTISANETDICQGDAVTIVADGSPVGGTYLWTPGGETSAEINVSPTVSTTYGVTYTTENQCFTVLSSLSINVDEPFSITLESSTTLDTLVLGTPIIITAITDPIVPPGSVYIWRINGQVVSGVSGNVLETIAVGPPFVVTVEIISPFGCSAMEDIEFVVTIPSFAIPNLFTPNRDGTNDAFRVVMDPGLTVIDFKVYSRWGKLVHNNPDNDKGWEGTFEGQDLPSDVYAYVITLRFDDGTTVTERGDITLLR